KQSKANALKTFGCNHGIPRIVAADAATSRSESMAFLQESTNGRRLGIYGTHWQSLENLS
ncbi:MAG: hypothetical protein NT069_21630, partial [Planctomycetota bacterium]|nr:hypothetical protein [Planctomycetota bacterium]